MGAIAVIRLSGPEAIAIFKRHFKAFGQRHKEALDLPYRLSFGKFLTDKGETIDEVMAALYQAPHSYTGQNVVEINCHGSTFIQEQIIRQLVQAGVRLAEPGEYTLRAYLNGKMDLSQAEAVADLIASENKAAHQVAMQQMRGGFSQEIRALRDELIHFRAMIELELDFSEEDVEFADREELHSLLQEIKKVLRRLLDSYDTGNVIKNGVPVAIVGAPNAGKSTLLNALLNEEKAIVTEIAGTTRDAIEDEIDLNGIKYRFIDTAGIRETDDLVESIGIKKTFEKIEQSNLVIYLFDGQKDGLEERLELVKQEWDKLEQLTTDKHLVVLANKIDQSDESELRQLLSPRDFIAISAKDKTGLEKLLDRLKEIYNWGDLAQKQTIVTNARHFHALQKALETVARIEYGLNNGLSGDLLAFDIKEAMQDLGSIIGEVDVDQDILGHIFGKFCIGK
jgi:tRNA modification GTPase